MFSELLETAPRRERSIVGPIASVIVHSVVIAATIFGTLYATEARETPKADIIVFSDPARNQPPPSQTSPRLDVTAAPLPPTESRVLSPFFDIPDVVPALDITAKVIDADDFRGTSAGGGPDGDVVGGTGPVNDRPYFAFQVEKPVIQAPGSPAPRYPESLRSGMIEGEVLVQFVVDSTGRAVPGSDRVFSSTHDLFTAAVRSALPHMRFLPAEIGGRKVTQLVQQRFSFATSK